MLALITAPGTEFHSCAQAAWKHISLGGGQRAERALVRAAPLQVTPEGVVLDPSQAEDRRTEAEKKFEEHTAKYEEARAKKAAGKSHRERVKVCCAAVKGPGGMVLGAMREAGKMLWTAVAEGMRWMSTGCK